ncbi:MAG: hypothetical protein GXX90_10910, partial [Microbacteriaceae bacterium]|nr:hypothetical protein [Microbacteriaceae bacterium]
AAWGRTPGAEGDPHPAPAPDAPAGDRRAPSGRLAVGAPGSPAMLPRAAQVEAEPPAPRRRLGPLLAAGAAGLVVVGLLVGALVVSGTTTQPEAVEAPWRTTAPAETGPVETDPTAPLTDPEPVAPGSLVPITQNAEFANGLTLVPPDAGDWRESTITNRPGQFTAYRGDYSAQIEVWQTDLLTSKQSDESLTRAQLNRIGDECRVAPTIVGEPEVHELRGADGTRLELLGQRATGCDGGEILMLERLMPHSGTRIHIVLWTTRGIDDDAELRALLDEVGFTVP